MSRRRAGLLVIVVGLLAALLAVLANPLGIGHSGFGWKQVTLLAIGAVLIVAGVALALPSRHREPPEELRRMRG